jgi:hypothetical protein
MPVAWHRQAQVLQKVIARLVLPMGQLQDVRLPEFLLRAGEPDSDGERVVQVRCCGVLNLQSMVQLSE